MVQHHSLVLEVYQLLEKFISVELARDLHPELVDQGDDGFAFHVVEKLGQCPSPVEPLGLYRHVFSLVSRDDVVHGAKFCRQFALDLGTSAGQVDVVRNLLRRYSIKFHINKSFKHL